MPIAPEALYQQIGQLVANVPLDLYGPGPISGDTHRWLGRAAVLVSESGDLYDRAAFTTAVDGLESPLRRQNAHQIVAILYRALARAETNIPAAAQGAFITPGAAFDVLRAVSQALQEAKSDVFVVEPYMDHTALTDFALLAAERVCMRFLADQFYTKADAVRPAAERWVKQYADLRPLDVRMSAPRALHDRLIIIDGGARTWSLTQSLKDFAARSPGSLVRIDDRNLSAMKRDFYENQWAAAQPL